MKRVFAILLLGSICNMAVAQFNVSFLKSSNQQLIEDAVGNGLMLICQEYQLEDTVTTKRYTLDGKPEFGKAISFAIKVNDGFIVSRDVLEPWNGDDNYKKYERTKYIPVLTRTSSRVPKEATWRDMSCLNVENRIILPDSSWTMVSDSLSTCGGFKPDTLYGDKDGWFVWLASEGDNLNDAPLSLIAYKAKVSCDKRINIMPVSPANTDYNLIGGVYLVPDFSVIGQMSLLMTGIVVKDEEGWNLVFTGERLTEKKGIEKTSVEDVGSELTAVATMDVNQDVELVESEHEPEQQLEVSENNGKGFRFKKRKK